MNTRVESHKRARLHWSARCVWGHLAGWGFVVGKTASCAAMALAIGAYLWPAHDRVVAVAAVMAITAINNGGLSRTVQSNTPLQQVVLAGRFDDLILLVNIGAGIAALGVLLNLIPGVSRTAMAMARERELPSWCAHIHPSRSLPLRAALTVAAAVIVLITMVDLRDAIAISGVAVLTYYAITSAAALTQR